MERATQRDELGYYLVGDAIYGDCGVPEKFRGDDVDRLAAYENTGMEPEDFKRAFTEDALLKLTGQLLGVTPDRLRELAQTDKDGKIKAYIVDSFYCDICQKRHARTKEIEVYLTRNAAESALRREQDG